MKNKIYISILILVFTLGFFLRFYKLGEVPFGFYQDESAIGFNAFSISQTGKDEHGQSFPLYFKSFGDYKLPVYIYETIIPIKIFGLSEFAVRFPSAVFGFLTLIVFYFFVKEITGKKQLAAVSTALLAINPWHIFYSRATFEVSISLFLFLLGGLFLHKAFINKTKGLFLAGAVCFILSLYSYNLTRLLAPLIFLLFVFLYRDNFKQVRRGEVIFTIIVAIISLFPFLATLSQKGGAASAGGTLLFSSKVIEAQLLELRSYVVGLPIVFGKLFFNIPVLTVWQYFSHVASYFSVPFFFISGSSHGNHGIGNMGQFYLFELPLLAIGVVRVIGERRDWMKLLLAWAALVILVAAATREAPHATRSFFLLVPLVLFSAMGLLTLWMWFRKRRIVIAVAAIFILYNLVYYFTSYYVRFPALYAKAWRVQDKALSLYLKEEEQKYDRIIFDNQAGFIYTSLLFYQKVDPLDFQKSAVYSPDDAEGFSSLIGFGKYEFKEAGNSDFGLKNSLIVTTNDKKPATGVVKKTFYYPSRPVVLSVKEKIAQYPTEEVAYVVIETEK